jgi:hypothetical protein
MTVIASSRACAVSEARQAGPGCAAIIPRLPDQGWRVGSPVQAVGSRGRRELAW